MVNAETDFVQADRILRVETPLGNDVLLAQKLSLREAVSDLFTGRVAVRSKLPELKPDILLGKTVDVSLELSHGVRRTWNALVSDLIAGPRQSRGLRSYDLILKPQLWLLAQTSDCRIWRDKTALDVARELLGEHGIPAPETSGVVDPVPPQHYSVQWNETDLAYLTRRLEEDGLFYWFTHEPGAHRMHIASHAAGYIGNEDVRFAAGSSDRNHITRFETTFRYTPGQHAGRDWNFETPGTVPAGATPSLVSLVRNGGFEHYEYPVQAGYGPGVRASEGIEDANVARVSRLRMQATEADHARIEGTSAVRTLAAGARFTPYDVADPGNTFEPHVMIAIDHEAVDVSYESVENQPEYLNTFTALPAEVPATPRRTTPHPRIDGAQVGIVAGPPGEEIHPDEYGRIKLWFPWDRRAAKDGSDTCWVRVAQNWAGPGWGGQVIPRIGMEVMVTYLDGDPDRPVVTGVVPNARQRVPYELPAHKTRSTFKTDTHKGEGFNELRFEDLAQQEEIRVTAQKDLNTIIRNNEARIVMNDAALAVMDNKLSEVMGNEINSVAGSLTFYTGASGPGAMAAQGMGVQSNLLSEMAYALDRPSLKENGAPGDFTIISDGSHDVTVGKSAQHHINRNFDMSVGANHATRIVGNRSARVDGDSSENVGKTRTEFVGDRYVLVCGQSRIEMKSSGEILISGVNIRVEGSSHIQLSAPKIDQN
ncbi:type VI secretion system Vgr family protein [Mesobaculum littorinae]|uniref:type VI secretion system Vgr family protein n=1 Tax=Mesobaculum littorinae TaxID=2486419 RepID=UPI001F2EB65E|nr:type VI secretion system tip protein TssI/VgrG [Mesobaculum littorinae]